MRRSTPQRKTNAHGWRASSPIFAKVGFIETAESGSNFGLGNVTAWAKYRFFRKVKTYGDQQAAFRMGLETPTGKKSAPSETPINAPAFVRQKLTPIQGGLAPHFDLAFRRQVVD